VNVVKKNAVIKGEFKMDNGGVIIICLVAAILLLLLAAGIAVSIVLWRRLPVIKSFFSNLARGIERNQVLLNELKSALVECRAELNSAIDASERNCADKIQEVMAKLEAESAARESSIAAAQTAVVAALGEAKTDFAANAERNCAAITAKLDAESAARESSISAAQTAVVTALGEAKTEFAANAERNCAAITAKLDAEFQNFEGKFNRIEFISDQCKVVDETLAAVKSHLESELAKLSEAQKLARESTDDNFKLWSELLEAQKTALDSLENDLEKIADGQVRRDEGQRVRMENIQADFEARLNGIQSSIQLLSLNINATAAKETAEQVKKSQKQTAGSESRKSAFVPLNGEKTDFETLPDGKTVSRTYRNGKLIFEILLGRYGVPERGKMFSESGDLLREFKYGPDGQVK